MATISGIRGMLLEEVVLYILSLSGYKTVTHPGNDPTLKSDAHGGLKVVGRGGKHQIDAIADFRATPPFVYPQRLLVEAKCYTKGYPVDIFVIRNGLGVLRDVQEYWVTRQNKPLMGPYQYHYAIFATPRFTSDAELYALAHGIYTIPLNSSRFAPIADAIHDLSYSDFKAPAWNQIKLKTTTLRQLFRAYLCSGHEMERAALEGFVYHKYACEKLDAICRACWRILGIMVSFPGNLPALLTWERKPSNQFNLVDVRAHLFNAQLDVDSGEWLLRAEQNDAFSFTLTLPLAAFAQHTVLHLKQEHDWESPIPLSTIVREPAQWWRQSPERPIIFPANVSEPERMEQIQFRITAHSFWKVVRQLQETGLERYYPEYDEGEDRFNG